MAMKPGDPRAKAFGRKGGKTTAANRRRRQAQTPPGHQPPPDGDRTLPLDANREAALVDGLKRNAKTLTQIAESVDEKVILGVIVRIIMSEREKSSVRIQAAQTWLRHHGGDPLDTTAIAGAIVALEGDLIDLDEFKEPDHAAD